MTERILVIRLGALGDLIMCRQAFHEIRQAHSHAKIALLTRAPFATFAAKMPWFDQIIIENHPGKFDIFGWRKHLREIRDFAPTRVYDLQGKRRQSVLYTLLGGPLFGPEWSGAAPFCTYPRAHPQKKGMHFVDFLSAQLRRADVSASSFSDIDWLDGDTVFLGLPPRFVTLIPGCAPGGEYKRWPPEKYAELAKKILAKDIAVVAVGGKLDAETIGAVRAIVPEVIDLSGRTDLFQLAGLLRKSAGVVGNDTGPMHMAASLGTPTLALFSAHTNPDWSYPYGPRGGWLRSDNIADIGVEEAFGALEVLVNKPTT